MTGANSSDPKTLLRVVRKAGLGLYFANWIANLIRKNPKPHFNLHFTSHVIAPQKLFFHSDFTTLASFSASGGCYFQANNGIHLGKCCLIGPGVKIVSSNHDFQSRKATKNSPIRIGNHVWLGANAIILPGVSLREFCVVGAGSVVSRSFLEPGILIAGNPAKKIKQL